MPRIMGIDYGLERTGLSISDPEAKLAFPLVTLSLSECGTRKKLIEKMIDLIYANNVEGLVFGLPEYTDGTESPMCAIVRNFAARISRRICLPVFFESEILSSEKAKELLTEAGVKKEKQKKKLDQAAACIILRQFLEKNKID